MWNQSGARGGDILLQFLIEAITLSLVGGILGIGAGIATVKIMPRLFDLTAVVTPTPVIAAFAVPTALLPPENSCQCAACSHSPG